MVMETTKVMEKIHEFVANKYVHNLFATKLTKVTLFSMFSQTGAANISDGVSFLMVEELDKLAVLLGANIHN